MMQNNRIQYLDLIRGGLILYVVFYHMSMPVSYTHLTLPTT